MIQSYRNKTTNCFEDVYQRSLFTLRLFKKEAIDEEDRKRISKDKRNRSGFSLNCSLNSKLYFYGMFNKKYVVKTLVTFEA